MTLRRLYLYLVSAVSLGLWAAGLALLGNTVLLFLFNYPSAQDSRTALAGFTAMTAVALPVWGIHFWFARRYAMRDPSERASAIRRLYVYWACLAGALGALVALASTAGDLLRPLVDVCPFTGYAPLTPKGGQILYSCPASQNWLVTSQAGWVAAVFLAIWAFHFWIAARDRAAAGETGASATLRRWYMYAVLLVGLLVMLSGASSLLQVLWLRVAGPLGGTFHMADAAGLFTAGFVVWGFHARTVAQNHVADYRHSTLRAAQGFIALAVSIAIALFGASQILYYALARALGVDNPGGAGNDILGALASPASLLVVYGTAWFLMRRRLARDAETQEGDRQANIRRLYTNLACLVSLGASTIGAGGLLWTLAEQVEGPIIGVAAGGTRWKDPASLWLTLLVVGSAVWLAHWRQAPWAADRQALPRRLYVWAALLAGVLAVLGGGVGMLAAVLRQVFSARPTLADSTNLNFGHYLAVVVVAAGVGFYHWRVLRADAAARPPKAAAEPAPAVVAAVVSRLVTAPGVTEPHTHRYLLSVTDATEDDVHQALSSLPPHAAYKLTPAEIGALPVDGR
ncbi:MAG: DUF5671 domain-containing protein [Candidatus Dormibacteraceae bacterium]